MLCFFRGQNFESILESAVTSVLSFCISPAGRPGWLKAKARRRQFKACERVANQPGRLSWQTTRKHASSLRGNTVNNSSISPVDEYCILQPHMGRIAQNDLIAINRSRSASALRVDRLNIGRFDAEIGCYSPSDLEDAERLYRANCGPASFSAVCRSSVVDAMRYFPHFPERDYTTIGDMRRALSNATVDFLDTDNSLPQYGLALLQLRVNDRRLHPYYSLHQTHWVGVCGDCFYDGNWGGWLPIWAWKDLVFSRLRFGAQPARHWTVRNAIQLLEPRFVQAAFGQTAEASRPTSACGGKIAGRPDRAGTRIPTGPVAEHRLATGRPGRNIRGDSI